MSYTELYIRYEDKFLKNTYSKEKLETSKELKSLESYFKAFDKFLTIVILLESVITNCRTFSKTSKEKLSNFIKELCSGTENYHEIAEQTKETEIKQFDPKIPKFSQQLNAFVYGRLIEFPKSDTEYETVRIANFLRNVYRIIKVKTYLHHFHMTGKSLGYVHDFRNWRVRENKAESSCIAHSFLGFDIFSYKDVEQQPGTQNT